MMTPEETKARAERAADWWNQGRPQFEAITPAANPDSHYPWERDCIGEPRWLSHRMLIALCQDLGWRDPIPTEAEAVVWLINRPESDYRIMFDKAFKSYAYYFVEEEVGEWVHGWRKFNPVEEATRLRYAVKGEE